MKHEIKINDKFSMKHQSTNDDEVTIVSYDGHPIAYVMDDIQSVFGLVPFSSSEMLWNIMGVIQNCLNNPERNMVKLFKEVNAI